MLIVKIPKISFEGQNKFCIHLKIKSNKLNAIMKFEFVSNTSNIALIELSVVLAVTKNTT